MPPVIPPASSSPTITIKASDLNLQGASNTIQATDIETLLSQIYLVAGIVAVVAIIIGAVRYTTSGGDASNVKAAKDTILYAVVGLVVIILAAAITDFVVQNVGQQ